MFESKGNIVTLAGVVILLIATFLPFASVELTGESVSLFQGGDGKILLVLLILTVVFMVINKKKLLYGFSGATVGLGIFELFYTKKQINEMGMWGGLIKLGAGYYLIIVGAIVVAAGVVLNALADKKNA